MGPGRGLGSGVAAREVGLLTGALALALVRFSPTLEREVVGMLPGSLSAGVRSGVTVSTVRGEPLAGGGMGAKTGKGDTTATGCFCRGLTVDSGTVGANVLLLGEGVDGREDGRGCIFS